MTVNHQWRDAVAPGVTNLLHDRRLLLPVLLTAVVIAVGSVLIVALAGGASAGAGASTSAAPTAAVGGAVKIDIVDFKYKPATLTVNAGAKVTWVNSDSAPHTATVSGGGFDTGTLRKGDMKTLTLDKPGTYAYICEFHPFMKATVVVR